MYDSEMRCRRLPSIVLNATGRMLKYMNSNCTALQKKPAFMVTQHSDQGYCVVGLNSARHGCVTLSTQPCLAPFNPTTLRMANTLWSAIGLNLTSETTRVQLFKAS